MQWVTGTLSPMGGESFFSPMLRPLAPRTRSPRGSLFFQAEDGIRALYVPGVQTCALPIFLEHALLVLDGVGRNLVPGQVARSHRGRSEERREGKSVDLGGRRIIKKKKKKKKRNKENKKEEQKDTIRTN